MDTKSLIGLAAAAVVLGGAAYFLSSGSRPGASKLNGREVLPGLRVADVARIEVGSKLALAAGEKGWVVETYRGYPASREKIADNLMKLHDLKVGQTVRGKKLGTATPLLLKDASGKELANLPLGERHAKWGHGRYATFEGETVLLSDSLDAFDGDAKAWVETKIVDEPWISFNDLADEKLTEAELGFATGVVAKVTVGSDTNATLRIGNAVKGGSDRYVRVGKEKWTYVVSSYSVDKFLPKPPAAPQKEDKKTSQEKPAAPSASAPSKK